MRPVEDGDVADPARHAAADAVLDLVDPGVLLGLAAAGTALQEANLDQLVIGELLVDLRQCGVGQAGLAEVDERIEVVRQTAQTLSLGGGEGLHPPESMRCG